MFIRGNGAKRIIILFSNAIYVNSELFEGGIPFDVRVPRYNKETEEAIQEARDIMSGKVSAKAFLIHRNEI